MKSMIPGYTLCSMLKKISGAERVETSEYHLCKSYVKNIDGLVRELVYTKN